MGNENEQTQSKQQMPTRTASVGVEALQSGIEYNCYVTQNDHTTKCVPLENMSSYTRILLRRFRNTVIPCMVKFVTQDLAKVAVSIVVAIAIARMLGYKVEIRKVKGRSHDRSHSRQRSCSRDTLDDFLGTNHGPREPFLTKLLLACGTYTCIGVWYILKLCKCSLRRTATPMSNTSVSPRSTENNQESGTGENDRERDTTLQRSTEENHAVLNDQNDGQLQFGGSETSSQTSNPVRHTMNGERLPLRKRVTNRAKYIFSTPIRVYKRRSAMKKSECVNRDDYIFDHPVHSLSEAGSQRSDDLTDPAPAGSQ